MISIDLQLFAFEIFRFPVNILQAFPPALPLLRRLRSQVPREEMPSVFVLLRRKGARLNNQSLIKVLDWKINTHQYTPDVTLNSWKYFVRTALNVTQCELLCLSFTSFAGFGFARGRAVWQHMHARTHGPGSCLALRKETVIKLLHLTLFQSTALNI